MHAYSEMLDYQIATAGFIEQMKRVAIWLDMGWGKTVSAATAMDYLITEGIARRWLVTAPKSVANDNWEQELNSWEHLYGLKVSKILGDAKQRKAALNKKADVYIVNHDNVPWLTEQLPTRTLAHKINKRKTVSVPKKFFDGIIIDETRGYRGEGARFSAMQRLSLSCEYIVELTGTPAPNNLMGLWTQIYLLDHGKRLGRTITDYRKKYFHRADYGYTPDGTALDRIKAAIRDICFTLDPALGPKLPPRLYQYIDIELSQAELKAYRKFQREAILELTDRSGSTVIIPAKNKGVLYGKLLQYASGGIYDENRCVHVIHDAKITALKEKIEEYGRPTLVAYSYKHELARLRKAFPGAVEYRDEPGLKDRWNRKEIPIMFVHPASAGHGLNLQFGGSMIIWFSLTADLDLYLQLNKRLHRPGQEEQCVIFHLVANGTIDDRIVLDLPRKDSEQGSLLSAMVKPVSVFKGLEEWVNAA